ncbi:hypothetical protein OG792_17955 [Micromonospora sp. NBC_01699]|uniref:hypothetical protein n=1 Tax=Micromonospora sp. NBC_01699 TaxID=2975984 RepID=UPI002E29E03E|nr:hypothetical protein [Micromonospora sp. NBC_01699]
MSEHDHRPGTAALGGRQQMQRPLVKIGDIVNAEQDDYQRGTRPHLTPGDGDLHMRVTYLPRDAAVWGGDWLPMRGVEMPPGGPAQPEMPFVVHRRALPGYVPPRRSVPPAYKERNSGA